MEECGESIISIYVQFFHCLAKNEMKCGIDNLENENYDSLLKGMQYE